MARAAGPTRAARVHYGTTGGESQKRRGSGQRENFHMTPLNVNKRTRRLCWRRVQSSGPRASTLSNRCARGREHRQQVRIVPRNESEPRATVHASPAFASSALRGSCGRHMMRVRQRTDVKTPLTHARGTPGWGLCDSRRVDWREKKSAGVGSSRSLKEARGRGASPIRTAAVRAETGSSAR